MAKKLSLLLVAIAATALAMPAFASAGRITKPLEVLAPVGTLVTAKSTNLSIETSFGTIGCELVTSNGEITENAGGNYNVTGLAEGATSGCAVGGVPVTVTDFTLSSFGVNVGLKRLKLTLKVDLPGITCHFESKAGGLEFVNGLQMAEFGIPIQELEAKPAACKPGKIEGNFHIEETGGGVLLLD